VAPWAPRMVSRADRIDLAPQETPFFYWMVVAHRDLARYNAFIEALIHPNFYLEA